MHKESESESKMALVFKQMKRQDILAFTVCNTEQYA